MEYMGKGFRKVKFDIASDFKVKGWSSKVGDFRKVLLRECHDGRVARYMPIPY